MASYRMLQTSQTSETGCFLSMTPVSLAEKVATGHGGPVSRLTNYIAQKGLCSITDSDALVGSAVDRFQNPIEIPAAPSNNPVLAGVSRLGSATCGVQTVGQCRRLRSKAVYRSCVERWRSSRDHHFDCSAEKAFSLRGS